MIVRKWFAWAALRPHSRIRSPLRGQKLQAGSSYSEPVTSVCRSPVMQAPSRWSTAEDGGPRLIKRQQVSAPDWEVQGRKLMHVYPATHGPHNPNIGHAVGMAGAGNSFNLASHNYDRLEEGMVFVLHAQWLEPLSAGANLSDFYAVTHDGFENLSCHTPLATHRVPA